MYSYTYDESTGGILLNSTPTLFSKEPRPVYAQELDMLGFDKYWKYEKQNDIPYMWAESVNYLYRGKHVAKLKGGDLYHAPEIILTTDENGNTIEPEPQGGELKPIDLKSMILANQDLMDVVEGSTVKKIVASYEKYKNKLDIFHVAFSGGKDSEVLLDLVRKALPKKSFVVVFGDTGMEFPDTYKTVDIIKKSCEENEIPFYISKSHFKPCESWRLFGPPARVLRWCCSVHKSTPQTLKLREITGKDDYVGLDYVGVRKHESTARSEYEYENFGKKQKGQFSFNAILDWTSAEVWLYLLRYNLPINEAYKKGNSRAGCLFCPMGGNKGDYVQYTSYRKEITPYIEMIKEMNRRDQGNEQQLDSYVSCGGWNARKNGRDLTINEQHYKDEITDGKCVITVTNPRTDWRQWIKTLGDIPFTYYFEEVENGYKVSFDAKLAKQIPTEIKKFKQVFHKAAHCVGCRVCETNCRFGCISFKNGLEITNCLHCGQCHEIDDGCLAFHSLRTSTGGSKVKEGSINSFANHAPKLDWIRDFFEQGNDYWEFNGLGPNQVKMFQHFLRDAGILNSKNVTTDLFSLGQKIGWQSNVLWGLILANLAYNAQFTWYINNLDVGVFYEREKLSELLMADGVSKKDATSVINAYKRFCETPLGTVLGWGSTLDKGRQIDSVVRSKCFISDNIVLLYSLVKFAEKCNDYREFTLAWLMNTGIERTGISPTLIYGLDYEEMKSVLLGLSAKYPDYIDASFTNDLDKITIKDKTSMDVLKLCEEEL